MGYVTIGNSITRATKTMTTTDSRNSATIIANATTASDTTDCSDLNGCPAFEDRVVIYFPTRNVSYI